jgi:hypothetical protein
MGHACQMSKVEPIEIAFSADISVRDVEALDGVPIVWTDRHLGQSALITKAGIPRYVQLPTHFGDTWLICFFTLKTI